MDQPDHMRRWLSPTGACALIAVASLVLCVIFVYTTNSTIDRINQSRANARVVACQSDRDTAQKINALNDRTQQLLEQTFNAPRPTPRSAENQKLVDAYLKDQKAKFDAVKVEVRRCDPESIREFYGRKK